MFAIALIGGCSTRTAFEGKEAAFQREIGTADVNTRLRLVLPQDSRLPSANMPFPVVVWNISKEDVWLKQGFGVRLMVFSSDRGSWNLAGNKVTYAESTAGTMLGPEQFQLVNVMPVLTSGIESTEVRVIVQGRVVRNGVVSGEETAAFIDVSLK